MLLKERHNAENIASWVEKIPANIILAILHDNESNVVAAFRVLVKRHGLSPVCRPWPHITVSCKSSFDSKYVGAFQAAAAREISERWVTEMVSVSSLDPRLIPDALLIFCNFLLFFFYSVQLLKQREFK